MSLDLQCKSNISAHIKWHLNTCLYSFSTKSILIYICWLNFPKCIHALHSLPILLHMLMKLQYICASGVSRRLIVSYRFQYCLPLSVNASCPRPHIYPSFGNATCQPSLVSPSCNALHVTWADLPQTRYHNVTCPLGDPWIAPRRTSCAASAGSRMLDPELESVEPASWSRMIWDRG